MVSSDANLAVIPWELVNQLLGEKDCVEFPWQPEIPLERREVGEKEDAKKQKKKNIYKVNSIKTI